MRPRSLYKHIYMHFLGVLVAVGAVSALIFTVGPQRAYLVGVADHLAAHTAALIARAPAGAERVAVAQQLANELDLDLALYDADGKLIAQHGDKLPAPTAEELRPGRAHVTARAHCWFVLATVQPPGERPLTLQCTAARLRGADFPRRPVLMLLCTLLLVAVAVRPLARRISRPIEWLIVASRRFGEGDLSTRVRLPEWPGAGERWRRKWRKRWSQHVGDELLALMHAWNDMAERIERQVGAQRELLANVSHELRSPLARVRVALALLPESPETKKRIADIEADLGELDALIEQILQTSRLEATGLPTHLERFTVAALYDEVLGRAAADPITAPLAASVVASADTAITLSGDRALLRRALFNLIENAAKYGAAPVTLDVERNAEGVVLSVRDAGVGIAESERERMLRPFARGDRAHTPGRGGVGLGLSFAARVAEVHGGSLALFSANGSGLLVRLQLPAQRVV